MLLFLYLPTVKRGAKRLYYDFKRLCTMHLLSRNLQRNRFVYSPLEADQKIRKHPVV
jgi:hypothetical protein